MTLPPGFHLVSYSTLMRKLPQLQPMLQKHLGLSETTTRIRIQNLEQRQLVKFAMAKNGDPSCFIAPHYIDGMNQYTKDEDHLLAKLLVSFWDTTGRFDAEGGVIVSAEYSPLEDGVPLAKVITPEEILEVEAPLALTLMELGRLTKGYEDETGAFNLHGSSKAQVLQWIAEHKQKVAALRHTATVLNIPAPREFGPKPHWQVALDRKMEAINGLKFIETLPQNHPYAAQINWMDLNDDLQALRAAEVYSFSLETMHAILTGAKSIPHESTLKSVEIPTARSGWFWFAEPFPLASSPIASDNTAAVLWAWDTHIDVPALRFSAYVMDEKGTSGVKSRVLPSTKWLWPLSFSFHEMIALNLKLYRQAYGPGGQYEKQAHIIGEEATMLVVAELSLFFLMSCLWFKQTVPGKAKLSQTDGHIERHARKRYQKELKVDALPRVRVIALRKSAASLEPAEKGDGTKSHLHVRFVVAGHARLQPCGPGHKDRKLIWVDSFLKGPDDAPFKASGPRVHAVVR